MSSELRIDVSPDSRDNWAIADAEDRAHVMSKKHGDAPVSVYVGERKHGVFVWDDRNPVHWEILAELEQQP